MKIAIDDVQYAKIASAFVDAFLLGLVRTLHHSDHVAFDVFDMSQQNVDLIFEIAFGTLGRFEDHGGVMVEGSDYVSHVAFAMKAISPATLVGSTRRTDLHGNVDDSRITKAIEAAKAEIGSK